MKRTLLRITTTALALVACIATIATSGCTENQRARRFGGTSVIELPVGQRVVGASWKDSNLWIITRDVEPGESLGTVHMHESSNLGLMEGHVELVESGPPPAVAVVLTPPADPR